MRHGKIVGMKKAACHHGAVSIRDISNNLNSSKTKKQKKSYRYNVALNIIMSPLINHKSSSGDIIQNLAPNGDVRPRTRRPRSKLSKK